MSLKILFFLLFICPFFSQIETVFAANGALNNFIITSDGPKPTSYNGILEGDINLDWPARPRRYLYITSRSSSLSLLPIGISASIPPLDIGFSFTPQLGHEWKSTLMLIKTVTDLDQDGIIKDRGDSSTLNYQKGVSFVGICSYDITLTTSSLFKISAQVVGSGLGHNVTEEGTLSINQEGLFFAIKEGDNIKNLMDRCQNHFRLNVQESIEEELQNLAHSYHLSFTPTSDENLKLAVKAFLKGPEQKRVFLFNHHWNIRKPKLFRSGNGNRLVIMGTIERTARLTPDLPVHFIYTYDRGELVSKKIMGILPEDPWYRAAIKTLDFLTREQLLFAKEKKLIN